MMSTGRAITRYRCVMNKWHANAVTALRAAVFTGSIVEVVRRRLTDEVLQPAGDGLLDAIAQGEQEAAGLAAQCAASLREPLGWGTRSWPTNWRRFSTWVRRRCFAAAAGYRPAKAAEL